METLKIINFVIALIFFVCYAYQFLYIPVPFLKKAKPHKETTAHRYAILICARNEENVLPHLIESIKQQTYDQKLLRIFVMADNCTDRTAAVARAAGVTVYERFNALQVGKGYALDTLLQNISADCPDGFDGYFVFDADNLLEKDYIEQMNRTFSDGYEIVTSYRNSKNYGDNWISAGYALWFLRESRYLNHARMLLNTSCAVSGTGFMFSQRILDKTNGWHFYLLTEDIEFSVHHILDGETIGICPEAVLYDEQPTDFRQSCRQRLRWAKGYLQVFRKYGVQLLKGGLHGRFACFDMSMAIMPAIVLTSVSIVANLALAVIGMLQGGSLAIAALSVLQSLGSMYLTLFVIGCITTATEWTQIHTTTARKIGFALTFPMFMFTYIPVSFAALFTKVEWKPIEHHVALSTVPGVERSKAA